MRSFGLRETEGQWSTVSSVSNDRKLYSWYLAKGNSNTIVPLFLIFHREQLVFSLQGNIFSSSMRDEPREINYNIVISI